MWLCVNIYTICIYIYKCMYVCICVCIHVHVCHAYIVCHEYIDTCVYLFPVHLEIAAMPWWSDVWAGSPELPHRAPSAAMFASHAFLLATSDIPLTLGRKNRVWSFGGKKSWLRNEGSWPVPPRGSTTGMGRERELRERDGAHKRSRNYSRKLRGRTPLQPHVLKSHMSSVRLLESVMLFWLFFLGFRAGWVHSDSAVVSDWQGVGGVSDVCISVHCTHSACQKQWYIYIYICIYICIYIYMNIYIFIHAYM